MCCMGCVSRIKEGEEGKEEGKERREEGKEEMWKVEGGNVGTEGEK